MSDTTKQGVTNILMERDGLSLEEARKQVQEVQDSITLLLEQDGSLEEAETIIREELGLEPDYLDDFLISAVFPGV